MGAITRLAIIYVCIAFAVHLGSIVPGTGIADGAYEGISAQNTTLNATVTSSIQNPIDAAANFATISGGLGAVALGAAAIFSTGNPLYGLGFGLFGLIAGNYFLLGNTIRPLGLEYPFTEVVTLLDLIAVIIMAFYLSAIFQGRPSL